MAEVELREYGKTSFKMSKQIAQIMQEYKYNKTCNNGNNETGVAGGGRQEFSTAC